jgi:hypothetical protein
VKQTVLRNIPAIVICLWGLFFSWFHSTPQTLDQLTQLRWIVAGSPTLRLKLTEQSSSLQIKKYEVSVRWNVGETYLAEFAVPAGLVRTLQLAFPPDRLHAALQLEVKIAGLDERGCIIEGGAQQIDRAARHSGWSEDEEIQINMKTLPQALCML